MSYINYKLLYEKGLTDQDYHLLQKIFQKETLLLETEISRFKSFEEMGLVQYLKKQENTAEGIRVSRKGKDLLSKLETPEYTELIGELVQKLSEMYESHQKHVGTKLEVKNRMIWFMGHTGFSSKIIYKEVEEYLSTSGEYTRSLENLIWSPPSKAFSTHMNLKNSLLFELICKKYNLNESFFVEKKNNDIKWMGQLVELDPHKKVDPDLFFTGSYEGDLEHINKVKQTYQNKIKL